MELSDGDIDIYVGFEYLIVDTRHTMYVFLHLMVTTIYIGFSC
jgi:hypothetical protein